MSFPDSAMEKWIYEIWGCPTWQEERPSFLLERALQEQLIAKYAFLLLTNFAIGLGQNKVIDGLFHSFALTLYWKVLQERLLFIIFSGCAAQRGLWPPRYTRFRDLSQRCATVGRTPLDG
jgi:hypothetical protein